MRIEFQQSPREDFHWHQTRLRIGSDAGCDLVLAAGQVAAEHLLIEQDSRGWVLAVTSGAGRIYVNARPVRERALLRPGDMLGIGECRLLLHADEDPRARAALSAAGEERCPVGLRAVSGPLSGRVLPVLGRMQLGQHSPVAMELPQGESAAFRVGWEGDELRLVDDVASERYPLRVNGTRVGTAALRSDDQIGVGMHRFIVDAPGLEPEQPFAMPVPVALPLPEDAAGPRGEAWWLILTAALLALGIALMLLVRF